MNTAIAMTSGLHALSIVAVAVLCLSVVALLLTSRMVDEKKLGGAPTPMSGIPPRTVLSDAGKKLRLVGEVGLSVGLVLVGLFFLLRR